MRYERLLASRYIKAQKRQSAFTVVSIIAAVAIMTMVFLMYSVITNFSKLNAYSEGPYHLLFGSLTKEQGEALQNEEHVRSIKLAYAKDGTVTASVLFDGDIGDKEVWLQNAANNIGAKKAYELRQHQWNDKLMQQDNITDDAKLKKLRLFSIFFIFALIWAFALRMIIDTAFEVSSKERERHYGVLQSIGATPEQIVKIITAEGLKLCVIAIPFGLAAGIVFAYIMYRAVLASGIAEMFQGTKNAMLNFPFFVDPKMLVVSALFGMAWVFFSAYGVGMRIIKKTPMEAIITRTDEVKKVKKRTLSGFIFGVSGSIASRNARRQKKRFVITVLTLTVSITLFALFSSLTETVEKSMTTAMNLELDGADFWADLEEDPYKGITYEDGLKDIEESGLFRDIGVFVSERLVLPDTNGYCWVDYINKEEFEHRFSKDSPISYEELVSTGGYIINSKSTEQLQGNVNGGKANVVSQHRTIPIDKLQAGMDMVEYRRLAENEDIEHEITVLGNLEQVNDTMVSTGAVLIGAIETYQSVQDEWFGDLPMAGTTFSYVKENDYNSEDYKKIIDWINEHIDTVSMELDNYGKKWQLSNIMSTVRTGVLILNVFIALTALINLVNIVSTGIANRRGEMASLQCVGMTDRQLYRMTMIECLQFAGAAAIISAVICAVVIFGSELVFNVLIDNTFVTESEERIRMFKDMIRIDHVTPFVRIGLAALSAFAAGAVTSFVMLRIQNKDNLADQIRGSEMKPDFRKSHLLRNSVISIAGAAVLIIAGLRTYAVVSYRNDRKEYEKAGYLNLVNSNGFKMNVYSTGAKNGKHTIVGLAGWGSSDFPVVTPELNELLGKENTVVYPDRAGYGFSDDSLKPQTLEQVVEDYRTGLKNAGFEAPYVFMVHSYGSYYALWWEMKYPDEVEAIVFMSGTDVPENECWFNADLDDLPTEKDKQRYMYRPVLYNCLGLNRLDSQKKGKPVYDRPVTACGAILLDENIRISDICYHRSVSAAMASEEMLMEQSYRELSELLKPTDIPKLDLSNIPSCEEDIRETIEFMKADYEAEGRVYHSDPETEARIEWQLMSWYFKSMYEHDEKYFMERIGNCKYVTVPGDHAYLITQQQQKIAEEILKFLAETIE